MSTHTAARRSRVKARKKTGGQPKVPRLVAARYERELVAISRRVSAEIAKALRAPLAREDAETVTATLGADFGRLRVRVGKLVRGRRVSTIVDQWGREITEWSTADMQRVLRVDLAKLPVGIRDVLADLRRENVELIESIGMQQLDDVEQMVRESVTKGTRVEVLARRVQERYGVSESRARLIARDQTLKANADLTAERHAEAGITEYVWSSSRDERVRRLHADLDGSVQRWASAPVTAESGETNHPGRDYQCRCVAVPVLD